MTDMHTYIHKMKLSLTRFPAVDFCHKRFHLRCCKGPKSIYAKVKKSSTEHIWLTANLKGNTKSK